MKKPLFCRKTLETPISEQLHYKFISETTFLKNCNLRQKKKKRANQMMGDREREVPAAETKVESFSFRIIIFSLGKIRHSESYSNLEKTQLIQKKLKRISVRC